MNFKKIFFKANYGGAYIKRPMKNIHMIVHGVLDIFDGLVKILTLGFYGAGLSLDYTAWTMRRALKKQIRKEQ